MSRPVSENGSITLVPNAFDNTVGSYHFTTSTNATYQVSNAYKASTGTSSYARLQLASSSSSTRQNQAYFDFDKTEISNIPSNATNISVACKVRYAVNSTTYVSAISIQLRNDTTNMGSATTSRSTSNSTSGGTQYTLSAGTWTLAQLQNIRLYISATHNRSTNAGYLYFYGCDITITYTVSGTEYQVTISNSSDINCYVDKEYTFQGRTATVTASSIDGVIIKDNGTDVTSQFVATPATGSYTVETASGATYGFALNNNGYYESGNKGIDKSAAVCVVNFHLPTAATITFSYINYAEATYDFGIFGNIDVALNNNYKPASGSMPDSDYRLACNTSSYNSSSVQTLTYTMSAGDHFIYVKFSKDDATASNNDTLQFKVAITLTETPPNYYVYTIPNISSDHAIVITEAPTTKVYLKVNGSWVEYSKIYKKVNGNWVEQSDFSTLFDSDKIYVKV